MLALLKITVFIFYFGSFQLTTAFSVMTGNKPAESLKITRTTRIIKDKETPSISPEFSAAVSKIQHHNTIKIITQVFAVDEPCEVNDSSSNKRTFNCSSSSSPTTHITPKAKHCSPNSRLVDGNCLCNEGYRMFPFNELCVKENGQPCKFHQNDCSTDLTNMACINNVCSCETSDIYDHITSRCVGRVGSLCYPGVKDCTLNAECTDVPTRPKRLKRRDTSSNYFRYQTDNQIPLDYLINSRSDVELSGRCQCKEGFVESQGGLCKKTYGQSCNAADECDTLNLVCNEGVCDCPSALHVYDRLSKSCVSLVGSKCSEEPGGTSCVKLASCRRMNLKLEGRCECIDDAVETNVGTCVQLQPEFTATTATDFPISSALMAGGNINSYAKNEQAFNRILFDA